ncbi:DUF2278 family protein, partial [Bradyrhizobium sp. Ec3.3]|uniref:DUF2278 family protein n=1 Tax=Bradyrhizobium sp. Ec3.3 TaxID=189753 RepID=UPI0005504D85
MTHRRKPPGAIRHYGVLVGTVVDGLQSSDGSSPHYEIHVGGAGDYRIAVNVQSVDDSEVLAYFDADFARSGTLDLKPYLQGNRGFRRLETGPSGSGGLDYLRDKLFPVDAMQPIPATGRGVSLKNLLNANIKRAKADRHAMVVAFGEYFEDHGQTDKYFHFRPERGIHDIHMMQGNRGQFASDNRTHGDGALFISFDKGQEIVALFVRFQTQSLHTDDRTGAPLD